MTKFKDLIIGYLRVKKEYVQERVRQRKSMPQNFSWAPRAYQVYENVVGNLIVFKATPYASHR